MIDWKKFDNAVEASILYRDSFGKTVAQRVVKRPAQPKTVADAVEHYSNGWPKHMDDELWFSDAENRYMRRIEVLPKHKAYFVCDYLQFEAYVKEQEGEKWTHETAESEYCRILIDKPDQFGNVVILKEEWGYSDYPLSSLKPIKPTMTKEQHEFLCKFSADSNNLEVIAEVESYLAKHDII